MAWVANIAARGSRLLAALVCVLAILLAQTPCAMAMAPATQVSPVSMNSAGCSPCCSHAGFGATTQTCCATHSQPAESGVVYSAPAVSSGTLVVADMGFVALTARMTSGDAATPLPPPLLPSILRI